VVASFDYGGAMEQLLSTIEGWDTKAISVFPTWNSCKRFFSSVAALVYVPPLVAYACFAGSCPDFEAESKAALASLYLSKRV
jgi:hypothetical protein